MSRSIHPHPVLLALYPALHLLAENINAVRPRATFGSLAAMAAAGFAVWIVCSAVLRDRGKGALLAALTVILFFSHAALLRLTGAGTAAAWILLAGGSLILAAAGILLSRWRGDPRPWNRALDVAALVLVLMALVPVVESELHPATNLPTGELRTELQTPLGYLPDIYVIIMDAFGRADQLEKIYGVDLSGLQDYLTGKGFEIPALAHSNYNQTSLSLAALLNSGYLEELLPGFGPGYKDHKALNRLVQDSRDFRRLRDIGYQLVTIAGGSELTAQVDPDVNYRGGVLNEFQASLLAATPLPTIAALFRNRGASRFDPFAQHRETVRYQLAKLPHVVADRGPKLVFAHVICPHPPFVIGPEGEDLTPDYEFSLRERSAWRGYVPGYAGQATWLSTELRKTVAGILAASRRPPVILIMGDHGPAFKWISTWRATGSFRTEDPAVIRERMSIFLALLMPPGRGGEVQPGLTPVNVFPLIFERCFGEPAQRKKDASFFSTYEEWSTLWNVDRFLSEPRPRPAP